MTIAMTPSLGNQIPGIFLVAFLTIVSASAAQTNAADFSPAEKWVVEKVAAGEIANLAAALNENQTKRFPNDEDRKLGARFLEDLLTGMVPGVKPHRKGVRIRWAIVDEQIDLRNAQIPWEVWLDHCQFNSGTIFTRANVGGSIWFDESTFKANANFSGMKVDGEAVFFKCVFEGRVTFSRAEFVNNFEADAAQFQNVKEGAIFYGIKVGGGASFKNAVFEGPAEFVGADITGDLQVSGAHFQNKESEATFNHIKVRGGTHFNNTVFQGRVNFVHAEFFWLDLSNVLWPKTVSYFDVREMSYKYIQAADEDLESHEALLKLADQSAYSPDVYGKLEEFFKRQGYRADADRAFVAGERRQRKEKLSGFDWIGNWLLDWLVGYGRHPWQTGIPCIFFVVLGCLLFSRVKMELQKPEELKEGNDPLRGYSRLWYSLGLFLPFVDLKSDRIWKPQDKRWFLRHYMRVHILLGWILIPILLAAISGLIK